MSDASHDVLQSAVPACAVGSRAEFQAAVRALITHLEAAGVRQMWWVSPDFADWPLDEPEVIDALTHWARQPGAQLTWVSHDFERIRRAMPRLTRWRQTFSHALVCRSPQEMAVADLPTLLVAGRRASLRLIDRERVRGWLSYQGTDVQRAHEEIDVILQRSSDAFASVTLGL